MTVLDELQPGTDPVLRLGAVVDRVQETGFPESEPLSVYLDRGVVKRSEQGDNHNVLSSDLSKYQRVLPGDLVFNRLRTWQGGFGASRHEGIVSPAYIVLRPQRANARYLDHVLHSAPYLAELTRLSKWMPPSQFDILWRDLRAVRIAQPALAEQRRIADFLDDRVARIDRIIAARRQQRILVAERREVAADLILAAHWAEQTTLRRFIRGIEQGWSPQCDSVPAGSAEWGVLKLSAVRPGEFREGENKRLPDDLEPKSEYEIRAGDLLITRASTPAMVGMCAVVPLGTRPRLLLCDKIMRVDLSEAVLSEFVSLVASTRRVRDHLSAAGTGTSQSMVNIRGEDLRTSPCPRVALDTQRSLVIDHEQEVNALVGAEQALLDSIDLLAEYKTSLITAAVTGELDVTTAGSGIPNV